MHTGQRLGLGLALWGVLGTGASGAAPIGPGPRATLAAYASEAELKSALDRWREPARRRLEARRRALPSADSALSKLGTPAPAAAQALNAEPFAPAAAESITNKQTAGVDEGGIVKLAGGHLLILRRGRLFTVRVGGDALRPVASVDAYAPGSDPAGAWYDELLVSGSTVVVIGYSYARGGTEIGLFELGEGGQLTHRATHHLRSFDYYSSRNYASRLIGRKLVFYSPTLLHPTGPHPLEMLPGQRRWHGSDTSTPAFERILPATRVYRTDDEFDPDESLALHTVTGCELGSAPLRCESSAVLGPAGRVFYVASGAVYVWTTTTARRFESWPVPMHAPASSRIASAVFRIPLDGAAPTALKTAGVPIDQMSFLEDGGGHLNVLLRETGEGEGMWGGERTRGAMAVLLVPLADFGDGSGSAQPEHYRRLPGPAGHGPAQNRFVGDWLLWGGGGTGRAGGRRGDDAGAHAWALRFAAADDAVALRPGHAVERIEAMGRHAVLVGNAGADLHFSSTRLEPSDVRIVDRHVQTGARQGETRTHGFFHHATGEDQGLLGLPILGPGGRGHGGVFTGDAGSASVLYLSQRDLAFGALGRLQAHPRGGARDDGCKASCVDWYGNARPLFLRGRVFALLGYELVEAQPAEAGRTPERIEERRRISFLPAALWREGRYSPFN